MVGGNLPKLVKNLIDIVSKVGKVDLACGVCN